MSFETGGELFETLWADDSYRMSLSIVCDVEGVVGLRSLNVVLALSHLVVMDEGGRGANVIAFVSRELVG